MATTRTTLVLGAGASCPYGFPTASELRELILLRNRFKIDQAIRRMHALGELADVADAFIQACYEASYIQSFRDQFFLSQTASIDNFVQNRPEFDTIARHTLSAIFSHCERRDLLDGDWYQLFRRVLLANGPDFDPERYSIITFNYDRSLEYFLWRAIQHTFGLQEGVAYQHLQRLSIHHVYGSLGDLRDASKGEVVPFADTHYLRIDAAAKSLRLVPPRANTDSKLIDEIMTKTEFLCFVGFGFWQENFDLVAKCVPDECGVFASSLGLSRLITDRVSARFPKIKWGHWNAEECFLQWNLFP